MNREDRASRGISVRNVNFLMALVMMVISILLLIATYNAKSGYSRLRVNTEHYIQWQHDAYDLQTASDYLTEQVRCFAETGKRTYLDNYFEEAEVTRRRDRALKRIYDYLGDTRAYEALDAAMSESVELMNREYYSMRLTVEAYGGDLSEYPEAVRQVALTPEDAALSPQQKEALARSVVFDDAYHEKKQAISRDMQECLDALVDEIGGQQEDTANQLDGMLFNQRLLIIATICITVLMMLMTLLLVIGPLLKAVMYIRSDEPIPIRGSNEFQFLARTYNLMYEANREQKEQLAYEVKHDRLTGIYNRSGYDFFLRNVDWETSALVLFDVDRFKQVNDSFGHDVGDRVLVKVAEAIRNSFRSQDYVCRIGGDEFAVIMVHANPSSSELIRQKVARINETLSLGGEGLPPIRLSCGAVYGAGCADTEKLFKRADNALYRVKGSGGSGCEVDA